MSIPVAPSIGGSLSPNIAINVGTIRNTGVEATLGARLLDNRFVSWSVNSDFSADRNRVVSLNADATPLVTQSGQSGVTTVIRPGYPLNGFWATPITSYADENGDGFIESSEVRFADSAAFLGSGFPKYTLNASTTIALFNGRVNVNTMASYENGMTQLNQSANLLTQIYNDPQSTFGQQAAVVAGNSVNIGSGLGGSDLGRVQTVSTLRWSSLSINWITPQVVARWLRSSQVAVTLQGSNLGLHSNYSGKDPNVNAFSNGNLTEDSGQLPQPRTWSVRVDLR
jgi:iron complex outermembrane receptor protein